MRLASFRIVEYRSIRDSGTCRLGESDSILILAGQNESGKSSLLQGLYLFDAKELTEDCVRFEGVREDEIYPDVYCTFLVTEEDEIVKEVSDEITLPDSVKEILEAMKEVALVREFYGLKKSKVKICDPLYASLRGALEKETSCLPADCGISIEKQEGSGTPKAEPKDSAGQDKTTAGWTEQEIEKYLAAVAEGIYGHTPHFIMFDDLCDMLPDNISIAALKEDNKEADGIKAVRNIESILDIDLTLLDSSNDQKRKQLLNTWNTRLTTDFNEYWQQRIFEDNKAEIEFEYNQGREADDGSYVSFFVRTKPGGFLRPKQRSRGFIWFLSFYLELKAAGIEFSNVVILFDEPGLFLHARAQRDIKALFEELAETHQVIYATHSPYLIDPTNLHRLRLVWNDGGVGTVVTKVTNSTSGEKRVDALKPVIDAIGLEVAHSFSSSHQRNVIVEGISDYYYLHAMRKLLGGSEDYAILPSQGAPNVHLLMELCIGWGLDWVVVLDDDPASSQAHKKIEKHFPEESAQRIVHLKGCKGIEEAFTQGDLKLIDPQLQFTNGNAAAVTSSYGKELFARLFLEAVVADKITSVNLSKTAKDRFDRVLKQIEKVLDL